MFLTDDIAQVETPSGLRYEIPIYGFTKLGPMTIKDFMQEVGADRILPPPRSWNYFKLEKV